MIFAYDVTLIATGKSLRDFAYQLQSLLNTASDWARPNLLTFNYSKCNAMFIPASPHTTSAAPNDLTLDGRTLATIDHETILGVVICSHLSLLRQARAVCGKISGRLAVFRRFSGCMNTNIRRQVFKGFVKLRLTYCLPVWGQTTVAYHNQNLLTKCFRFILHKPGAVLDLDVFNSIGICNFTYHVLLPNVVAVFNTMHSEAFDGVSTLNYYFTLKNVAHRRPRLIN